MNIKALIILLFSLLLISQEKSNYQKTYYPLNYGGYIGTNFNLHSPDFFTYPAPNNTNLDINFNDGATSMGFNIGALINYPIDSMFTFTGRLGYHSMGVNFENSATFGANQEANYKMDNSLGYLEITPGVQVFNLIPVEKLYLLGGLELGVPIIANSKLDQKVVADGSTNQIYDNDIATNVRFALMFGAGYVFRQDNWLISPELSFRFPVNDVSSEQRFNSWSAPQIRLGVNITFGLFDKKQEKASSFIDVKLNGPYTFRNNKKSKIDRLKVEEIKYSELFPLVPYVFFDQNESTPNQKYQTLAIENAAGGFEVDNLSTDAIEINKSTLDIIGKRMQENPEAIININGTTSGTDESEEIAKKRADFAKNYLVMNYGLKAENIRTGSTGLPRNPSSTKDEDGIQENRRLEISTTFPDILNPLLLELDRQTYATPNLLEFDSEITSSDSTVKWNLEINQLDKLVRRFDGDGFPNKISWNVLPNELARTKVPIDYTFTAENSEGDKDRVSGSIPVDYFSTNIKETKEQEDKIVSKFSLIVFDFDSPKISDYDKEILKKYVVPSIGLKSTIKIYGYSDRIGKENYNKKLALARANAAKDFIKPYAKNTKIEVFGIGEDIEVYDNNIPVGRHLSRTVQIYIITPKN